MGGWIVLQGEVDAARRAYDTHMGECRQATLVFERRVSELDLRLSAASTEHSAHLAECAASKAAAAQRIAELEAQLARGSGELNELMKKFMDLTAAKVTTDTLNSDLQAQAKRDGETIVELRARLKVSVCLPATIALSLSLSLSLPLSLRIRALRWGCIPL